jgi:hypothetical protein
LVVGLCQNVGLTLTCNQAKLHILKPCAFNPEFQHFIPVKALAWIFPLYFQLLYLPEETCFQPAGSSGVEVTSQPVTISKK